MYACLRCPVNGYNRSFSVQQWTATKQSVIRYLKEDHARDVPVQHSWCAICKLEILNKRAKYHPCLRARSLVIEVERPLRFTGDQCNRSFTSRKGLNNHISANHPRRLPTGPSINTTASNNERVTQEGTDNPTIITSDAAASPTSGSDDSHISEDVPDEVTSDINATYSVPTLGLESLDESPSAPFTSKFRDILANFNDESWPTFCAELEDYILFAQKHAKLPPPAENGATRKEANPHNHRDIQRTYKRNRRQAMRLILGDNLRRCELSLDDIIAHFNDAASSGQLFDELSQHPNPATEVVDVSSFQAQESRELSTRSRSPHLPALAWGGS